MATAQERAAASLATPPSTAASALAVFRFKAFRYLLGGALAGQFGQWVQNLGQGWLVYQLTGSAFQLSLVAFCQGAAFLTIAPVGGALCDRFDRKKLMLVSQLVLALTSILLTILVFTGAIRVWHLYVTSFLAQGAIGVNNPVRQALVNDVVGRHELPRAIAINSLSMNTTRVIGPAIGGTLLATIGVEGTYAVQAACMLAAMASTFAVALPPRQVQATVQPILESIRSGFTYVWSEPKLLAILGLAFSFALLGWGWQQLIPAYVSEELGASEGKYGVLMTAMGIGAMSAALFITFKPIKRRGRFVLTVLVVNALLMVGLGVTHSFWLSLAVLVGLGAAGAIALTMHQTLLQTNCDDRYRGRVISLWFLVFGLQPIGMLPAGALAEAAGTGWAIAAMGALHLLVLTVVILRSRTLRTLQ